MKDPSNPFRSFTTRRRIDGIGTEIRFALYSIFFLKRKRRIVRGNELTSWSNNTHENSHMRDPNWRWVQQVSISKLQINIFVLSSSFFFSSYAGSRQSWFGDQEWGWSRKTGLKWHQQAWSCLEWHWMDDHDHQSYEGSVYQGQCQPFQTLSTRIEIGPSIVVGFRRWPILTPSSLQKISITGDQIEERINYHLGDSPSSRSFSFIHPILRGLCKLNKQLPNCPTTLSVREKRKTAIVCRKSV